jgi:hypothetical protein
MPEPATRGAVQFARCRADLHLYTPTSHNGSSCVELAIVDAQRRFGIELTVG